MTNLTEQWKEGELPYDDYYIKLAGGEYTNDVWDVGGWQSFNKKGDVVVEVLAPVPSYEEWKEKNETLYLLAQGITERNKQIDKLKDLLKECRHIMQIEMDFASCHFEKEKLIELIENIDEVLNANKA